MKNSETDRDLTELISSTLDNYEEQYILGSWENFVKKRKRRKKLILWFTSTGIAATLMIGWLGFRIIYQGPLNSIAGTILPQESKSKAEIQPVKKSSDHQIVNRQIPSALKGTETPGDPGAAVSRSHTPEKTTTGGVPDNSTALNAALIERSGSDTISGSSVLGQNQQIPDSTKPGKPSSADPAYNGKAVSATTKQDSSGFKSAVRPPDYVDNTHSQKFRFGVNVAPGVASTGTSSSFAYSGGVSADYSLSRSIRLSTGLQVEHQNVINENPASVSAMPSGQTQAELTDLDLPLNLTWKFVIRKATCYYVSGGISSVVYLSEKYTNTNYVQKMVEVVEIKDGVENVSYQLENFKTTQETTEAPLNTFDFAGRVNIIFGFEQHLTSRLFLHIEPFLKIPISDLATQNMKFTTSGITCKISF